MMEGEIIKKDGMEGARWATGVPSLEVDPKPDRPCKINCVTVH